MISRDKLLQIAVFKSFVRHTFAKKDKTREFRENLGHDILELSNDLLQV